MKSKRELKTLASSLIMLLCITGPGAAHAEAEGQHAVPTKVVPAVAVRPSATQGSASVDVSVMARAALAAQRDVDPQVNGTVRDVPGVGSSR